MAVFIKAVVCPEQHSVWPVFAAASRHWWTGQSLYASYPDLDLWRYSCTMAVALTPLALLPLWLGGALWGAGNALVLLGSLRALERHVFPDRLGKQGRAAFLIVAAVGAAPMLWNLQSNALVLALVAYAMAALAKQRWWTAAFLLAAPVYIKLWPLAAAMLLIACWPRRLLGRFAAAMMTFALVPFLAGRPATVVGVYGDWALSLLGTKVARWPGYRDLWTVWELVSPPVHAGTYVALQLAAALAVLVFCLLCCYRPVSRRQLLTTVLGSWVCWQLLWGPATERNTYGLMAPLMAWGVVVAWQQLRASFSLAAAVMAYLLFSIGDLEWTLSSWLPAAPALLPLSVVLYAVWFVQYAWPFAPEPSSIVDYVRVTAIRTATLLGSGPAESRTPIAAREGSDPASTLARAERT